MKNNRVIIFIVLTLTVILLPLFALPRDEEAIKEAAVQVVAQNNSSKKEENESEKEKEVEDKKSVRLYFADTKKIEKISMEDYIFSVVAAECPMLYSDEAIKAQIVAAHTFTLYRIEANKDEKYDVSTDPNTCQAYVTREKARENWGSGAEEYEEKLNNLMNEVMDYVVLYKNEPIFAAYHAISSGKTEDAKNVWGNECKYLKPVQSNYDKLATNYLVSTTFNFSEIDTKLKIFGFTGEMLSKAKINKTSSGYATTLTSGGKTLEVSDLVAMLNLRSNNIEITSKDKKITITTRGYGHGVGMSQNGANYMAKNGSDFIEILKHYYSGVEVEKIK